MKSPGILLSLLVASLALGAVTSAQTSSLQAAAVPSLVNYSEVLKDDRGRIVTGITGVTFLIYKDQEGGAPLWLETQNVRPDDSGRFTAQLGSASAHGLPAEVFMSGEGRWLAVRIGSEAEQPRVLMVAVPYAMKAADAETIGGLPPSAFVLANPRIAGGGATGASAAPTTSALTPNAAVTGTGTVSSIPLWDTSSDIVSSIMTQTGSGSTARIGINTATPGATLDVKGAATVRGTLGLPSSGLATATAGKNSYPLILSSTAFNSGTAASVTQTFRLQTEPAGNNSDTPSGKLNLLFYSGTNTPTETGLSIASNGQITFASGQTFPGLGTITGVTAGTGLVGGGTNGNVTLNLDTTKVPLLNAANTFSANQTVNASLSAKQLVSTAAQGTAPLHVTSTTLVPNLNASFLGGFSASSFQPLGNYATLSGNNFTGSQNVTGNITASGTVTGSTVNAVSSFNLGGNAFGFGSYTNGNAFLGFAGNLTMSGLGNVATGYLALAANSTGGANTAYGYQALARNLGGGNNEASGAAALQSNTSGNSNTAEGSFALSLNSTGNYNTAVGFGALQGSLGSNDTAVGLNAGSTTNAQTTTGSNNTFLGFESNPGTITGLNNATAIGANSEVTVSNAMVLGSIGGVNGATADTFVGIGTTAPAAKLDVHGTANFTGLVTFASGQTFPGTGTITGVAAGTGLTGGGTSGGVTLNVDTTKVVTGITAGTDLTGGGTGGALTLNLDTTKVPSLASANTFTANQTVNANLIATAVGIGTASPLAPLHIDHLPAAGGQDVLLITSAKSADVASLLIQNTAPGTRLRAGAGTDAAYLASSGAMKLIAGDTGTPSHPGSPNITIDTAGHVGIFTSVPAFTLDVNGNANFAGPVTFASNQTFPGLPQLTGANTFTGNQMVNGNVSATGLVTGSAFFIGGSPFAFGSFGSQNAFLGFAGNSGVTSLANTGVGYQALNTLGSGEGNTAVGGYALLRDTIGSDNTAIGLFVLDFDTKGQGNTGAGSAALSEVSEGNNNTGVGSSALSNTTLGGFNTGSGNNAGYTFDNSDMTGSYNTFYGSDTAASTGNLTFATAIGAYAEVGESNAIVLGAIKGVNYSSADTNVGIGTSTPAYRLHIGTSLNGLRVEGPGTFTGSPQLAASFGGFGDFSIDGPSCPGCRFIVKDNGSAAAVQVGIGTSTPDATLSVLGSVDKLGGGSWGTYSDGRLKNLHGDFSAGLKELLQLQPIRYVYKPENGMGIHDPVEHIGFVAQEVQRVIPEAVTENNKGYLVLNDDPILWTMLNAIKEQQREIAGLRKQLQKQAVTNTRLASRLNHIESNGATSRRTAQRTSISSPSAPSDSKRDETPRKSLP